ncbi:hypothetical protein ID866_7062 [Astraeus odoratus]|nr:hypothetical protein ID866_7062 [Astraeus odoratus]
MSLSSQPALGWHPNPQLMQQQQQQAQQPPAGWSGSWPPAAGFPPGYPGPPPMPHGAPPHWNAGHWQYHPHMRNAQQPWAPAMGWGVPANYNPYKRVPRPASPSYWRTELTDNGLCLEGMVKRERKDDEDGDEPHTPWIWNPPSLLPDTGDRPAPERTFDLHREGSQDSSSARTASTSARDAANTTGRRRATHDGLGSQSHDRGAASGTPVRSGISTQTHTQTPDRGTPMRGDYIYRSRSTDAYAPPSSSTPARHSSEPIQRSSHHRSASTDPSPSRHSTMARGESFSASRSHTRTAEQAPQRQDTRSSQAAVYTQEPESFTTRGDLQPTFSASIVRTPTYYEQPRHGTDERRRASLSPSRRGSGSRGSASAQPLARHSSMPSAASSRDPYSTFADDLTNSLPPAASVSRSSSRSSGPLTRSRTEPTVGVNLTTIPETSSGLPSGDQFFAPLPEPSSSDSSREPSPYHTHRRSPYSGGPSPNRSPPPRNGRSPYGSRYSPDPSPRHADYRSSSHSGRRSPDISPRNYDPRLSSHSGGSDPSPRHHDTRRSPYSNRPSPRSSDPSPQHRDLRPSPYASAAAARRENPLPPPPMERPSLAASQPPQQEPPPASWSHRVRLGFWNRRGDHLTSNMFVVYAPEGRAYPSELRDYPSEAEGYKDHHGTMIPWTDRPELPASLPQRGRPPAQPYDSFVVYKYFA